MIISLELEQSWDTAEELRDYLAKLQRTLERICEMKAETPADWYFEIRATREGEYDINLTHL